MTVMIGDHVRDLAHLDVDLVLAGGGVAGGDGHAWFDCVNPAGAHHWVSGEDLVDSVGLLKAAAAHVLIRLGHAGRGEREYYLRAAADHQRNHGCPAMQTINRLCMFERHALTELGR